MADIQKLLSMILWHLLDTKNCFISGKKLSSDEWEFGAFQPCGNTWSWL